MSEAYIKIVGAREHNLKNVNLEIPRSKLVVMTGVSGSGKSSLAFDTIYAEGQRRYVESLSAYVRQFIGLLEKPDLDKIEGLSPAISIDQKGVSRNPRSTVGTVTEIYDYLRLLFARIGTPYCPKCGKPVTRQTVQQVVDEVLKIPDGTRVMILAPVVVHMKGTHQNIFATARQEGFSRVRVDGAILNLDEEISLDKKKWHDIEIVVDRLVINSNLDRDRLTQSVETSLKLSNGTVITANVNADDRSSTTDTIYSNRFACASCSISIQELEPRNFSFNTPYGACPRCTGLGYRLEVDRRLVIEDETKSINDGAIQPWTTAGAWNSWYDSSLRAINKRYNVPLDVPFGEMTQEHQDLILYGDKNTKNEKLEVTHTSKSGGQFTWSTKFEGVIASVGRRHAQTESEKVREDMERYMSHRVCPECNGQRLKPEVLAVKLNNLNIMDVCEMSVEDALEWISTSATTGDNGTKQVLTDRELTIGKQIFKEILARLDFLNRVGLGYIGVNRASATLSGGEAQRIRLATQIGSGLTGVLYVCDEPSIGLHAADNARLIDTLINLRDVGNTVIVVEHDEEVMRAADHIVDMGPGAGENGGSVVAEGTIDAIMACDASVTGAYLNGKSSIPIPEQRRKGNGKELIIRNARHNNLRGVDVTFPLGKLICVTGVSGSGKSTLVNEILNKALARVLYRAKDRPGEHDKIEGLEHIDKAINITQSPIGRTPRSNPATYTGLFSPIRDLFAALPESRARGYKAGRFSFNVAGGRCEACSGAGYTQIEMQFLPDITVPCDVCKGARYNREALEIKFKLNSIADILDMTVNSALKVFKDIPSISSKLETLENVGLGYIRLGQPATTLSGGEAQRIKLASELSKRATGKTLYILDEPTTGLSFYDCHKLINVLHRLVDAGNTVVLIEHHLDFIKNADWVIDLGPKAGAEGGQLMATGEPEAVVKKPRSVTGKWLKPMLSKHSKRQPAGVS